MGKDYKPPPEREKSTDNKKIPIPNYAGHVRSLHNIYGHTYGNATRLVREHGPDKCRFQPPIPLGPQYEVPPPPEIKPKSDEEKRALKMMERSEVNKFNTEANETEQ